MAMSRLRCAAALLAACSGLWAIGATRAEEELSAVQGVFCNTAWQLDQVLAHFDAGVSLDRAVAVTNKKEIGCSHIDLIHFIVRNPVKTGIHNGRITTAKYEALLTAVLVGDAVRPVSPPASVFFVTPEPLAEILLEHRL